MYTQWRCEKKERVKKAHTEYAAFTMSRKKDKR